MQETPGWFIVNKTGGNDPTFGEAINTIDISSCVSCFIKWPSTSITSGVFAAGKTLVSSGGAVIDTARFADSAYYTMAIQAGGSSVQESFVIYNNKINTLLGANGVEFKIGDLVTFAGWVSPIGAYDYDGTYFIDSVRSAPNSLSPTGFDTYFNLTCTKSTTTPTPTPTPTPTTITPRCDYTVLEGGNNAIGVPSVIKFNYIHDIAYDYYWRRHYIISAQNGPTAQLLESTDQGYVWNTISPATTNVAYPDPRKVLAYAGEVLLVQSVGLILSSKFKRAWIDSFKTSLTAAGGLIMPVLDGVIKLAYGGGQYMSDRGTGNDGAYGLSNFKLPVLTSTFFNDYAYSNTGVNDTAKTPYLVIATTEGLISGPGDGTIYGLGQTNLLFKKVDTAAIGVAPASMKGVAWGKNIFVATYAGSTDKFLYSIEPTATVWKVGTFPSSDTWNFVRHNGEFFLVMAPASATAYISRDAVNWYAINGSYPGMDAIVKLEGGDGTFMAIDTKKLLILKPCIAPPDPVLGASPMLSTNLMSDQIPNNTMVSAASIEQPFRYFISVLYPLYNGQQLSVYLNEGFTLGPFSVDAIAMEPNKILTAKLESDGTSIAELFPSSITTVKFAYKNGFSMLLKPTALGRFSFVVRVYEDTTGSMSEPFKISIFVRNLAGDSSSNVTSSRRTVDVSNARLPHQDPVYEIVSTKTSYDLSGLFGNSKASQIWPPAYDDPRIFYPGRYVFSIGFKGNVPENLVNKKITIDLAYCVFPQIDQIDTYWKKLQSECINDGGVFEKYFDLKTNTSGLRSNFPEENNYKTKQISACIRLLELKKRLLTRELYKNVGPDDIVRYGYNGVEGYFFDGNFLSIDKIRTGIEICINKAFPDSSPVSYIEFEPTFDLSARRKSKTQSLIRIPGFRLNIDGQVYPNNDVGLDIAINNISQILGFSSSSNVTGSFFCPERMIIACNNNYSPDATERVDTGIYHTAQYYDTSVTPPIVKNDNLNAQITSKIYSSVSLDSNNFDRTKPTATAIVKPNDCRPGLLGSNNTSIVELTKFMNSHCNVGSIAGLDFVPVYFFSANGALGAVINSANISRMGKLTTEFIAATLTARIELDISSDSFKTCFGLNFTNAGADRPAYFCPDGSIMVGRFYATLLQNNALDGWGYVHKLDTKPFRPTYKIDVSNNINMGRFKESIASYNPRIKDANYVRMTEFSLSALANRSEDEALVTQLPANQYRLKIVDTTARIDGHYKVEMKVMFNHGQKIAVKSILPAGQFKSMGDAAQKYRNVSLEFLHDGGEVKLWLVVKNKNASTGTVSFLLEKVDSYLENVLILTLDKLKAIDKKDYQSVKNEIGDSYIIIKYIDANNLYKIALPSLDGKIPVLPNTQHHRFQKQSYNLGQIDVYWPVI